MSVKCIAFEVVMCKGRLSLLRINVCLYIMKQYHDRVNLDVKRLVYLDELHVSLSVKVDNVFGRTGELPIRPD